MKINKVIAPGLIAVFSLFFSLISFGQGQQGISIDKIIARVDNHYILNSELEEMYNQYKAEGRAAPEKCQLLESLIINKMLLAKAEIDSVVVEDKEVDGELDAKMGYMVQRFGSEKNIVEAYGKSIENLKSELRTQVKEQKIVEKMQRTISGNVKITPNEVRKFFNSIPKDSLPYIPSEVEIGHIVKLGTVTREQKDKLKQQLLELKQRAEKGEDFATLAQIYSEDLGSAKNGGDLNFAKRGAMVPEFEGAALSLKPGEMSDIVESQFGFHLIKLIETRGAEYHARHILLRPDYNKGTDMTSAVRALDSLRNLIEIDTLKFAKAALDNSEDKETAESGGLIMDRNTGLARLTLDASMDPALYFAIDTMKVGELSKPVAYRTEDGRSAMRIIWYKSKSEPHTANLRDDYEKLAQIVLSNKRNNALEEWFKKAQGDVFISIEPEYKDCKVLGLEALANDI
ncbi:MULTISPECIES: peptidylprolyl isomerase [Dyadobacter]|uniref:Peptidylprolyl isomerase n=1 Tax=Dyadobacter chenhuakuii TaxID=2909339 RepID=A0A9X1TRK9_9BACT|nr:MULTISPECIES: peptidylprolyl isomerase [Dyadobacter]MCE7072030.1 peptidylprolyl isomerase [Dyadobacter sp. CY327]MCF2494991.1 peptidylprolyl isomerase [Dyadobacter chenhuakuii]MCF2498069.1 peptidylprolyl isomerase [Dyadobacter chenhuakuii]MCF2518930.1 peptidylprolyl isomerase [Dyadobacter sp. CY351]USJ31695.1 peptidylprolyl isomerase [Dyadobacter chenhuakuii]